MSNPIPPGYPKKRQKKIPAIPVIIAIIGIAGFIVGYMINANYYRENLNKVCVQTSSSITILKGFEKIEKNQYGETLLWCFGDDAKLGYDALAKNTNKVGGG